MRSLRFIPSSGSALFSGLGIDRLRRRRMRLMPFTQLVAMLGLNVRAVTGKQNEVLIAIVAAIMVQVMNALAWIQKTIKPFLNDQAVFIDVALRICVRMVWRVDPDIATRMHPASAAPTVIRRSLLLRVMARNKAQRVTLVIPTRRMAVRGERRRLSAPASTKSGLVRWNKFRAAPLIHFASGRSARPMAAQESFRREHWFAASALAGRLLFCHSLTLTYTRTV